MATSIKQLLTRAKQSRNIKQPKKVDGERVGFESIVKKVAKDYKLQE